MIYVAALVLPVLIGVTLGFVRSPTARVIAATLLGFLAGFVPAMAIVVERTHIPDCDGLCLYDEVAKWATPVGAITATISGFLMWQYLRMRRVNTSPERA